MKISRTKIESIMAENQMTLSQLSTASGIAKQNISTVIRRGTCTPRTARSHCRWTATTCCGDYFRGGFA